MSAVKGLVTKESKRTGVTAGVDQFIRSKVSTLKLSFFLSPPLVPKNLFSHSFNFSLELH